MSFKKIAILQPLAEGASSSSFDDDDDDVSWRGREVESSSNASFSSLLKDVDGGG
jgi:hypothetical protein